MNLTRLSKLAARASHPCRAVASARGLLAPVLAGPLLLAAAASAQTLEDARAAYTEGRFLEAVEIAEALGTSDGYALATKSLAIHGYYIAAEEEKQGLFERAMALGEMAVEADPSNPEAHYQSAHALGRYSQTIGAMTALRRGYGGRIRDLLEATLARDSTYWEAHLALAGWHADIVDRAGRFMARVTYGANRGEATTHFERAMAMNPGSRLVIFEYALRMPLLRDREGRELQREMMLEASRIPLGDAYDRLIQERLLAELEALEGG